MYAGGQSILIGTPSGVTLAPEGGAHQSIKTPSIGLEQPNCITYEPAFAIEAEWTLLAVMAQMGKPGGKSGYFRLSTKPVDQQLADVPEDLAARERRRRQVVAGGYLLRTADAPDVTLATMGVMVPETLIAADRLAAQGIQADVLVVTSPGLLYEAMQGRNGQNDAAATWILDQILPAERAVPMVSVLDGHPHTLSFMAAVNQVKSRNLGVTHFGQSGDMESVYRYHGIDADSIVRAALDVTA